MGPTDPAEILLASEHDGQSNQSGVQEQVFVSFFTNNTLYFACSIFLFSNSNVERPSNMYVGTYELLLQLFFPLRSVGKALNRVVGFHGSLNL